MRRPISKGKYDLCGGTFSKAAMTKHLKSCIQKTEGSGFHYLNTPEIEKSLYDLRFTYHDHGGR